MKKLILSVFILLSGLLGGCLVVLMLMQLNANKDELARVKDPGKGTIGINEKASVLETLKVLENGYSKRDVSAVDSCVANTFSNKDVFILGTNSTEILKGKEGAKNLLRGDWAYWGKVKFDLENSRFDQLDSTVIYMATSAEVKIDIWQIKLPLRITGVLVKENARWLISKLQFQYDTDTNLLIFSWIATIGFVVSMFLTVLIWLLTKIKTPRKVSSKY